MNNPPSGARPAKAAVVADETHLVSEAVSVEEAKAFGAYVAEQLVFGSNMRGGAEYRKQITAVLVRRAVLAARKER